MCYTRDRRPYTILRRQLRSVKNFKKGKHRRHATSSTELPGPLEEWRRRVVTTEAIDQKKRYYEDVRSSALVALGNATAAWTQRGNSNAKLLRSEK